MLVRVAVSGHFQNVAAMRFALCAVGRTTDRMTTTQIPFAVAPNGALSLSAGRRNFKATGACEYVVTTA